MSTTPPYPDGHGTDCYDHKRGANLSLAAWWKVPAPVSQWTALEAHLRDPTTGKKVGELDVSLEAATPSAGHDFNSVVVVEAAAAAQAGWPVNRRLAFDIRFANVAGDVLYTGTGFLQCQQPITHG